MFLEWQKDLILNLQEHHNIFSEIFFRFVSFLGDPPFYFLLLGFFYWTFDKKAGEFLGLTLGVATTLNNVLKGLFLHERPLVAYESEVKNIRRVPPRGTSFPSGHAQGSASMFAAVARYQKTYLHWLLAVTVMVLMGLSRMFLGMHYLQDVVTGSIIGVLTALVLYHFFDKFRADEKRLHLFYVVVLLLLLPGAYFVGVEDFFRRYGLLVGFMVAVFIEKRYIGFSTVIPPRRKVFRFVTGSVFTVSVLVLLGALFDSFGLAADSPLKDGLDFLHFFLVSIAGFALFPALCKKAPLL